MARGANSPARILHRVLTSGRELLELLEVIRGKVVVRHDHDRRVADGAQRREAFDRVVLQILVDRRGQDVRCHAADRYRVAIGRGTRHRGNSDGAAGARFVFHDHRLLQFDRKTLRQDAAQCVAATACRERQ
ncbi:hypothetical protein D3C72_1705450 [compost metagenome]